MIKLEAGKCYKISSHSDKDIYFFKIKDVTKERYAILNDVSLYGFSIKILKGFVINNGVKEMIDTAFPESYIFQEVEESDLDKLEHYYKIMKNSFNTILNKYQ